MSRALWIVPLAAGCAPVAPPTAAVPVPVEEAVPVVEDAAPNLPPAGYGSLRQDEFSVELTEGSVHVKTTPLTERVTRLAAPDTYDRLRALAGSRRLQADQMTEAVGAELFLVSFFSRDADVEYRPDELQLTHRGRLVRPVGIIPLTTGWGRQLLQPQQTQSAIYVFEPPFDYDLPLIVRYGLESSDDWQRVILPLLEEERLRVTARSGGRPDTP
jgi:hypothetical protein